jgi:aminoglycoside phosphotransferase (APT) family kinase protein
VNVDGPAHLLAFLREHLGDRRVEFGQAPRQLRGGAFTEVLTFTLTGAPDLWMSPLVLRLYPATDDRDQPRLEMAIQNAVADAGFPAPRVLLAHCEPDILGHMFVVMERLPGRAFLRGIRWDQFARDFPRVVVAWPSVLARVQNRLHELDPLPVLKAIRAQGLPPSRVSTRRHLDFVEGQLKEFGGDGSRAALAWALANEPAQPASPSVVHGDLWPANVLMQRGELAGVVDWNVAAVGDPALDVGFAKAGLALIPAPFPPPPPVRQGLTFAGGSVARRFHDAYNDLRPVAAERVKYYEALRCLLELATVARYRVKVERGAAPVHPRPPWDNGVRALTTYFTAVSGVPFRLGQDSE